MTRIGEALPLGPSSSGGRAGSRGVRLGAALLGVGLLAVGLFALLSGGGGSGGGSGASPGTGSSSASATVATRHPHKATATQADKAKAAFASLPLRFEQNTGQTDARVKFLSRGSGYTLFLTPTEAVLSLIKPSPGPSHAGKAAAAKHQKTEGAVLRMGLVGANPHAVVSGAQPLRAKSNYFVGKQHETGVANYREVTYKRAYPGIDLVYHGRNGRLEYDFNLAPGADPSKIGLDFKGAERITVDRRGDLVLKTAAGTIRQPKPVVYQRTGGRRHAVIGRYIPRGARRVGFRLGAYDHSKALVIDPAIVYSTYLGGTGNADVGKDVAVDGSGVAYVTGETESSDFPTTAGAFQTTALASPDSNAAFVSKIDTNASGGASLSYSTYLSGTVQDGGHGITVDGSGNAYVTGLAQSSDFPTKNPLPGSSCDGAGTFAGAAFVTKLNATGSDLVYSTCLGSPTVGAVGHGIAVDASGAAYVTGGTNGRFPTTAGAYKGTPGGGSDAFVAKLKPMASDGLAYSSYLGGAGDEEGADVAVDGSGNAYLTGSAPAGFPTTTGAFQPANAGGADAFVTKIDTTASGTGSLKYSTYLGGSGEDNPFARFDGPPSEGVAVKDGNAYVTGGTTSTNFPTHNPFQASLGGDQDAFVAKLNTAGSALDYSTYLGGASFDQASDIAVDSSGNAHVFGQTTSSGFPTTDALPDSTCPNSPESSAFVSKLTPAGSALSYSTCIPGAEQNRAGGGIAVDAAGNAYIAGTTGTGSGEDTPELEVVNGRQEQRNTNSDVFLVKLALTGGGRPRVSSLTPRGGPDSGQTPVVIRGQRFTGATSVSFGGTPAASFTVDSDTQITAVTPAHAGGKVYVTVGNPAGGSPAQSSLADFYFGEGGWKATGSVTTARRSGHTATLLANGKVLVAGGIRNISDDLVALASAELYDPKSGAWTSTGSMATPRLEHTATLLANGKVLVAGGYNADSVLDSAELYDPASGHWSSAGSMGKARLGHTATLLPSGPASLCGANCGKVLVVAGGVFGDTNTAELYNPADNTWAATGLLAADRAFQAATLLPSGPASICGSSCGKVLVSGGIHSAASPAGELYDPSVGTWAPTPGGPTGADRTAISSNLLPNGKVVAAGGGCFERVPGVTQDSQLFDPLTATWTPTSPLLSARSSQASAVLPSGKVLVAGGFSSCQGPATTTAEVFDPAAGASGSWLSAGSTQIGRISAAYTGGPSATVLSSDPNAFASNSAVCGENCGRVLIVGGTASALTELYTPPPTVTAVGPAGGSPGGGTSVTINGAGLNNGLRAVRFGGVLAASFSADSYGQITAVSPPHAAGAVDVSVVTEGGEVRAAGAFTYGAAPAGGGGAIATDMIAPGVSRFGLTNNPFVVGGRTPVFGSAAAKKRRHRKGTTFRYTLSEAASVRIVIAQGRSGRRKARRCVAPTRRLRRARRCVRIFVKGTLTRTSHKGVNSVGFSGRIGSKALKPGSYQATLTATDAAKNTSKPKTIVFKIVKR